MEENEQLIEDIYGERPDIKYFVEHSRIDTNLAEAMIATTFGKIWHVRIRDFETGGDLRDAEQAVIDSATTDRDATLLQSLGIMVGSMFKLDIDN